MEQGIRTLIVIWLLITGISVSIAQEVSTVGEVYDYEVSDVFHFRFWASSPYNGASSITNITIIGKSYSLNNDTVFYERAIAYHETYPNQIIEYYTDTVSYTNLYSLVNMGNIDTVYTDPNYYNGRVINHYYSANFWSKKYVDGCGKAYVHYNDGISVSSSDDLIYYKKGEEEWGTPVIVGIKDIYSSTPNIFAFPNPFTTSTTIEFSLDANSKTQISIYNTVGEMVYKGEEQMMAPGTHQFSWSPHHLPAGLYFVVLRSEDGVSVVKMIKE